jgi:hypothetical protein
VNAAYLDLTTKFEILGKGFPALRFCFPELESSYTRTTEDGVGYVAKLGIKLNLEWIVGAAPEVDSHCYAKAIAIDATGCNLYVTGSFQGTVDFDPSPGIDLEEAPATPRSDGSVHSYDVYHAFLWALDHNGRHSWVESPQFGPEPGSGGSGQDIAVSDLGRLSVVGWHFDTGISTVGAFIYRK